MFFLPHFFFFCIGTTTTTVNKRVLRPQWYLPKFQSGVDSRVWACVSYHYQRMHRHPVQCKKNTKNNISTLWSFYLSFCNALLLQTNFLIIITHVCLTTYCNQCGIYSSSAITLFSDSVLYLITVFWSFPYSYSQIYINTLKFPRDAFLISPHQSKFVFTIW